MTERFWQYVDSLHWIPAFKPGPVQAILRGICRHLDDTRSDILKLRNQFVIRTADDDLLNDYAKSRNVKRSYYDSEPQWRKRVEDCFKWYQLGGRINGLKRILDDYGAPNAEISNLRDENAAKWAEFFLKIPLPERTLIKQIYELIADYKPARSKMTRFHVTHEQTGTAYGAAAVATGMTINLYADSGV